MGRFVKNVIQKSKMKTEQEDNKNFLSYCLKEYYGRSLSGLRLFLFYNAIAVLF